MKNLFKILFIFSILFLSSNVFASNLYINTDKNNVKNNEMFTAFLYLDTDGESINTAEGDLIYDNNFLKIEKINIGNSFINFWVEKPDDHIPNLIHFSGITPGGVVMDKGEVFSIIFRAKSEGDTFLTFKNTNFFLNDGNGTKTNTKVSGMGIKIIKNSNNYTEPIVSQDKIVPDKFSITRTRDPLIYDNKYFLIFNSSDKGTGIDSYRICEYWSCIEGVSPHLLRYQNNFYYIKVSAYDGNGNVRNSTLVSSFLILLILGVFLLIYFFFHRYLIFNKV